MRTDTHITIHRHLPVQCSYICKVHRVIMRTYPEPDKIKYIPIYVELHQTPYLEYLRRHASNQRARSINYHKSDNDAPSPGHLRGIITSSSSWRKTSRIGDLALDPTTSTDGPISSRNTRPTDNDGGQQYK
jgi:hypothetical protein